MTARQPPKSVSEQLRKWNAVCSCHTTVHTPALSFLHTLAAAHTELHTYNRYP